jgi:hypothetical protein
MQNSEAHPESDNGGAAADAVAEAFPADDGDEPAVPGTTSKPGTRVEFENNFFNCFEEPYFRLTDLRGGEPMLVCKIGADEMLLPFKGITRECNITDDSPDGQMLATIGQALRYVKAIRPGDPLPPELFSDGVSWQVDKEHLALAHQKLSGQLLAWIFEGDSDMSAAELLDRMASDRNAKAKLNEAFAEAAKQLGLGEDGRERVAEMIEDLASDLAYIEALREKYLALEQIQRNLMLIQKQYNGERSIFDLARSVAQLHFKAVKEFRKVFTELDAQTGEIIAALKNIGAQKRYIRKARNKLHTRLMPWDEISDAWEGVQIRRSENVGTLLRNLYRFLAPRYMPLDEWVIRSAPSSRNGNDEMRWDEDDEDFAPPVRAMDWD